jgi:predicted DNA-binding transcriptional regulator YafY
MGISLSAAVVGRQARVLHILRSLQAGDRLNPDQLAVRFNVCKRTIFRDLKLLRNSGVNVMLEQDQYFLAPDDELIPAPSFSEEQLVTLTFAAHLSVLRILPDSAEVLRQTVEMLLVRSPHPLRHALNRLLDACHFLPQHDMPPTGWRVVTRLFEAIRRRRQLQLTLRIFADDGDCLVTHFALFRIEVSMNHWTLIGFSSALRDICSFNLRDIINAELTDISYSVPREFQQKSPPFC